MSLPPQAHAKPKAKPQAEQLEFFDAGADVRVSTMAVEIAPGVHKLLEPNLVPPDTLPTYGICKFIREPGSTNSFAAVAITQGKKHKLTRNIGAELGCTDKDSNAYYRYIKRLIWAGFVEAEIQPDATYVDLHSLFTFLRKTRHPGFWTKARAERLRSARDGYRPDADEKWPPPDTDN